MVETTRQGGEKSKDAMPHKIEVAPSGRAHCRGCKEPIAKGSTRFAEEYHSPYSEEGGLSFRYWHLQCAAVSIANELGEALAAYTGPIDDRPSLEALATQHARPPMPFAERASTGRARCRACEENIAKGDLRVVFERTYETPIGPQKAAAYAHARCLARYLAREKERGRQAPRIDGASPRLTTPPSADEPSAAPERSQTLDGASPRLTTPPSADVPSATPERGQTLESLLAQVRSNSKLAEEDLTTVENQARA